MGENEVRLLTPLKKLDERSKGYKFVGYAPTRYRLWDEEKRKIRIERNVKFKEQNKEHFQKIKHDKTINLLDSEKEEEEKEEKTEDKQEENDDEFKDAYDAENNLDEEQEPEPEEEHLRRSTRTRKQPERFKDYYAYLTYKEAVTGPEKQ